MSYGGLPYKHMKIGGRPAVLAEVTYAARSSSLILSGLCAVGWRETNSSAHATRRGSEAHRMASEVSYGRARQNFTQAESLRVPDSN